MKVLQQFQVESVRDAMEQARLTDATLLANARMRRTVAEDTFERVVKILEHIEYKQDHELVVTIENHTVWVTARHWRADIITGLRQWGEGGSMPVSEHATTSQIVQSAFGLFKALEEHEAREQFLYMGQRVFGPHIDINALVEAAPDTDHEFGTR